MARRVIYDDADCIISIGSNCQMLLGLSTSIDMTIYHVKLNNNTLKVTTAILITGQKKVWDYIVNTLPLPPTVPNNKMNGYYFPKTPLYPIFDKLNDPTCQFNKMIYYLVQGLL